jgi:hypothetical protein
MALPNNHTSVLISNNLFLAEPPNARRRCGCPNAGALVEGAQPLAAPAALSLLAKCRPIMSRRCRQLTSTSTRSHP